GCPARRPRWGGGPRPPLLEAVVRGLARPEADLPAYRPAPRPHVPAAVRRRADALRAWRAQASKEVGLDPGVLFPQRLIDRLAASPPGDLAALRHVEGVRGGRGGLFGPGLLTALASD